MTFKNKILEFLGLARADEVKTLKGIIQKTSEWGKLWSIVQEQKLFGDKVQKPYSQVANVYKAIKAIADNIPQADLKFYTKDSKKEIIDDPIINLFNLPNPFMTESEFIQAWVGFLALYGEVNIVKNLSIGEYIGAKKLPAELWIFNPTYFTEVLNKGKLVGWRYHLGGENIGKNYFSAEEVIHTKDFNPYNIIRGLAPTKPIEKIIDIDWSALLFNKAFFDNDATLGTMLSTDETLTEEQIERLTKWIEKRHQGASKAFKLAILEGGLKPLTTIPTHREMEFVKQKEFTRQEILGIWRVPQAFFNITEGLNYATFIGQMKMFWNYTIMPCLSKMTDMINIHIVKPYNPNIVAKFDVSNVVAYQEDFKEKVDTGTKLFGMGFTANEINERLELGFETKIWRDKWWINFGMMPAPTGTEEQLSEELVGEMDKSLDQKQIHRLLIWKRFLVHQNPLENRMANVLKTYFYNQRKKALESLDRTNSIILDWDGEDKELKAKVIPYILQAIRAGVAFGREFLTGKMTDEELNARISSYLTVRADKITRINDTVKNQIKEDLEEGIRQGETIMQLSDRVRDIYNMASGRGIMIARTETAGAVNGGSFIYYESEGVSKKQWLTAGDEAVRESHRRIDKQTVRVSERFTNGLRFPGDMEGEPEEIINCRCTLIPILE